MLFQQEISYDLHSDHSAIIVTYSGQTPISKTKKRYKQDWLKYKKYISSHIELCPALNSVKDIENCVDKINNVLLRSQNQMLQILLSKKCVS